MFRNYGVSPRIKRDRPLDMYVSTGTVHMIKRDSPLFCSVTTGSVHMIRRDRPLVRIHECGVSSLFLGVVGKSFWL